MFILKYRFFFLHACFNVKVSHAVSKFWWLVFKVFVLFVCFRGKPLKRLFRKVARLTSQTNLHIG